MISIIVPIYNVAVYLQKCLDSLAAQTFHDVEIILVNDGSTDGSEKIAEAYAEKNNQFFIYNTNNRGLSAARNLGIEKARGDWLMFVDSDDKVMSNFCDTSYQAATRESADLVIFGYKSQETGDRRKVSDVYGIVDRETAIRYGGNVVWNKLYRRELFDNIRFPEGRVYEDIATTYKIIYSAKRILIMPDILYYHIFRKDSISHNRFQKYSRDAFMAALEKEEYLRSRGCAEDLYLPAVCSHALTLLSRTKPNDDFLFKQAEAFVDSIQGIPSSLNWKKKFMLLVWKIDKRLFHLICLALGQKDA